MVELRIRALHMQCTCFLGESFSHCSFNPCWVHSVTRALVHHCVPPFTEDLLGQNTAYQLFCYSVSFKIDFLSVISQVWSIFEMRSSSNVLFYLLKCYIIVISHEILKCYLYIAMYEYTCHFLLSFSPFMFSQSLKEIRTINRKRIRPTELIHCPVTWSKKKNVSFELS